MYTMDLYQKAAANFENKNLSREQSLMMGVLGLASEVGEIAEAVKHNEFHAHTLDEENLKKELGDLLWYLTHLCTHYGWSLEEIADKNIQKLASRYPNGFSSERSINRVENLVKTQEREYRDHQ